jgi:hypothetical protein
LTVKATFSDVAHGIPLTHFEVLLLFHSLTGLIIFCFNIHGRLGNF